MGIFRGTLTDKPCKSGPSPLESDTTGCRICYEDGATEEPIEPCKCSSFGHWWKTRELYGPQGVIGDTVCLIVLTPLCLATAYLCGVGASAYSRISYWEGSGLAVLCCLLIVTYFLWLFVTIRFHYKSWKHWCKRNRDVQLLVKSKIPEEQRAKQSENKQNSFEDPTLERGFGRFCMWFYSPLIENSDPVYNFHQQTSFV